jgi:GxxExxY protein
MQMHENEIGTSIVDSAIHLHQDLGPGLLETVYEVTMAAMLRKRGFAVVRQVPVSIEYEGQKLEEGFRADLIVEGKVILELKSVEKLHPVHKKQLLTYLRLTGMKLGYLLNFGEELMKDGITRIINGRL